MKVLERLVQTVAADKWPQLMESNSAFEVVQRRFGFPPSRFYRGLVGSENWDTQIVEREWESMAALEAGWEKLLSSSEYADLGAKTSGVVLKIRAEIYTVL